MRGGSRGDASGDGASVQYGHLAALKSKLVAGGEACNARAHDHGIDSQVLIKHGCTGGNFGVHPNGPRTLSAGIHGMCLQGFRPSQLASVAAPSWSNVAHALAALSTM